jgi:exo-beta-1,3-glucanase (GH17 family)
MMASPEENPMNTLTPFSLLTDFSRVARLALPMLLSVVLSSCGGGGTVTVNTPASSVSASEPRALSAEFSARKAVAYSPFRSSNRDTETITAAMVKQDLDLLLLGNFRLIRLFDSSDRVAKLTLQVIRDNKLDIKVMLGAYVQSDKYAAAGSKPGIAAYNQAEMARVVALANEFSGVVLAVSVGNETMVSWSFNPISPTDMAGYLRTVRSQISQPITSDDNWAFYADPPKPITDTIDFVAMHTYAELDSVFAAKLWDWKQAGASTALDANNFPARATAMMNAAMAATKSDYTAVRAALDRKGLSGMPIVIGETGWNAVDVGALSFRAHPVNQKMYFQALNDWTAAARTGAGPANIFYFEAFDEPWKGNDDKWGLFNVNRQARYVIQNLNPPSAKWVYEPGAYTSANALYFQPLVKNSTVVASPYTAYGDAVVAGGVNAFATLAFNAFGGPNGLTAKITPLASSAAPSDGPNGMEITPVPADYGWGVLLNVANTKAAEDLTNFAAGTLHFSIQTTYPGKIEVGFSTGFVATTDQFDVWMPLSSGQYGYANDGTWRQVSIPIRDLLPSGAQGFGMNNSPDAFLDMSKVTNPFVIADRYIQTGKDAKSGITTKINIDSIYWTK